MSKSAQNCHHLQAKTPCTAFGWMLLLHRCICPVSPHWYLLLLSWIHQWTRAWPFKLGVWPTSTAKSCRGYHQGNAEAKRPLTVRKWLLLFWARSGWLRSSEQLHHLVVTLTWPVTDELLPARQDCRQIIKGIGDINADLPASSIIHFTTSPFHSMSQTNSYHHRAIPLSKKWLLVFRIQWHPRDVIFQILGLGEGDTTSHHTQQSQKRYMVSGSPCPLISFLDVSYSVSFVVRG